MRLRVLEYTKRQCARALNLFKARVLTLKQSVNSFGSLLISKALLVVRLQQAMLYLLEGSRRNSAILLSKLVSKEESAYFVFIDKQNTRPVF